MEGFLFQATIYLLAAVLAVPVATRLGLGSGAGLPARRASSSDRCWGWWAQRRWTCSTSPSSASS